MKLAEERTAALKVAARLLIGRLGGLAAAATVCRVSVPVLSEYQSLAHPERMMPVDVAMQLEDVAGEPVVTGVMARLQGYTLARPEAGAAPQIGRSVAAMSRHAGEVGARFLEAMADNRIDQNERAELLHEVEQVAAALRDVASGLALPGEAAVVLPLRARA